MAAYAGGIILNGTKKDEMGEWKFGNRNVIYNAAIFQSFVIIIHTMFYYHDKAIIGGAAAESAVMGAQYVRRYDKNYDIEAFFQEKIHGKLIYMTDVNITAEVNKEEVQVFAEAKRSFMKTNVNVTVTARYL